MAGDSSFRRSTSLKTYSRRVNRSFPAPTARRTSLGDLCKQKTFAEKSQRRVLDVLDENHTQVDSQAFHDRKQRRENKSALGTIPGASQRQALLEIDSNCLSTNSSRPLFRQSLVEESAARPTTSPTSSPSQSSALLYRLHPKDINKSSRSHSPEQAQNNNNRTINSRPSNGDIHGVCWLSPGNTRQPNSSHLAPDEKSVLESFTPHLKKSSKRRQSESPEPELLPETKKVKRSSIKSYFKPLPTSSSPPTSTNIFSDNLDTFSSPPTSPLSALASPKFHNSKKRARRNLSLKPSLQPLVTMEYEEDCMSFIEAVGNMEDENRVEFAERMQDRQEHVDEDRISEYGRARDGTWPVQSLESTRNTGLVADATEGSTKDARSVASDTVLTPEDASSTSLQSIPRSAPIDIPLPKKTKPTSIAFSQLHFISDRETDIICDDCGYRFNRTLPDEVREHSRFHKNHKRGNNPRKGVLDEPLWQQNGLDGFVHKIVTNRRHPTLKEREWYDSSLSISMAGGLDGPAPDNLWTEIVDPSAPNSSVKVSRYKLYVYTTGVEVVSLVLAERIARAAAFYSGPKTHDEHGKLATPDLDKVQTYVNLDEVFPVMVSIDRVWTHSAHRRNGYATKLVDHIRKDFIQGLTLHRCQVAFSLPTEAGMAFASKYCESAFASCPFVVNVNDARVVVHNDKLKVVRRRDTL